MAVFGYACLWSCDSCRVTHTKFQLQLRHGNFRWLLRHIYFYYKRRHRVTHTKLPLLLCHGNSPWLLRHNIDLKNILTSEHVRMTTPSGSPFKRYPPLSPTDGFQANIML